MKNKKKILSLIACLSLLSSCNRNTPSSNSNSITTSTPASTVTPTPSKTVEELNKELFDTYAIYTDTSDGSLRLDGFKNETPTELLNLETIIIPENVNEKALTELYNTSKGLFNIFSNLKTIKISSNINYVHRYGTYSTVYGSSPFINLPNLENIEVDSNNKWLFSEGNCLIIKGANVLDDGSRVPDESTNIVICGWKNVEIPEKITTLRGLAFSDNQSITTIKLNSQLDSIYIESSSSSRYSNMYTSFRNLENLMSIDSGNNTKFITSGNTLYDVDNNSIAAAWGDVTFSEQFNSTEVSLKDFKSVISVSIPTSVEQLGQRAFANTKIQTINLPEKIQYIDNGAFWDMKYLKSITSSSPYFSADLEKNCLIKAEGATNFLVAGWDDVEIPDGITDITNLSCQTSIKSIKIGNDVVNIPNLTSINNDREIKDFFTVTVSENNPYFHMNGNSLIKVENGISKLVLTAPNENGEVEIPSEIKTLTTEFYGIKEYKEKVTSIKLNEGLEIIEQNTTRFFSKSNLITKIDLPTTIKQIKTSFSGACFFTELAYLNEITIGGKTENDYFKIDSGCLIQKNAYSDGSDKLLFGYGDVVIPDYITKLDVGPFYSAYSIKTLTIHKYLNSYYDHKKEWSTFVNLSVNELYFNGTLEEFKTSIGSSASLYDTFTNQKGNGVNSFYYLNDEGNYVGPYTKEELKNL